jgi:hypothetical protein
MEFKRAVKSESLVAERKTWESRCGRYRVMESHIPLAFGKFKAGKHLGYADRYYALHLTYTWDIIDIYFKRGPAERACEKHEENRLGTSSTLRSKSRRSTRRKGV